MKHWLDQSLAGPAASGPPGRTTTHTVIVQQQAPLEELFKAKAVISDLKKTLEKERASHSKTKDRLVAVLEQHAEATEKVAQLQALVDQQAKTIAELEATIATLQANIATLKCDMQSAIERVTAAEAKATAAEAKATAAEAKATASEGVIEDLHDQVDALRLEFGTHRRKLAGAADAAEAKTKAAEDAAAEGKKDNMRHRVQTAMLRAATFSRFVQRSLNKMCLEPADFDAVGHFHLGGVLEAAQCGDLSVTEANMRKSYNSVLGGVGLTFDNMSRFCRRLCVQRNFAAAHAQMTIEEFEEGLETLREAKGKQRLAKMLAQVHRVGLCVFGAKEAQAAALAKFVEE